MGLIIHFDSDGVELKAPPGEFRVVCVDTFDGDDWVGGDFKTKEEAIDFANKKVKANPTMFKVHIYDDVGVHLFEAGKF